MKKLFFVMAAVAALLTSCSKDDTFGGPARGKVTFEVSTPELATRYGDGSKATKLYYAVYDMVENTTDGVKVHESTTTLTNGAADVLIDLVEGRKYTAIFWADAGENASPYTFDAATKTVSYTNVNDLTANNENYDAFFAFVPEAAIKVGQTVDVDLKRPFAQLNIATNDTAKAEALQVEVENTAVTVAGVYTSFNLANGEVQGEPTTVTFASAEKAEGTITTSAGVKDGTYDMLAMNYVLVNPANETLVDVTLNFTDDVNGTEQSYVRQYNKVKVQRNYRTNIIGSILTDETIFDVDIEEGFLTPDNDVNGDNSATQIVTTANEFINAINAFNDNDPNNDPETIVMGDDIELEDVLLIGSTSTISAKAQNSLSTNAVTRAEAATEKSTITINGNGKTITSSARRVIRIAKSNVNVIIKDLNVVSTAVRVETNDVRGIAVDPNLNNVDLTLDNCSVVFEDPSANDWAYAVNVAGDGTGHNVTINGGEYEGANVVNVYGANNTVKVNNATLTSTYPAHDTYFGACIYVKGGQGSRVFAKGNKFNGTNAVAFNIGDTELTESDNIDNCLDYKYYEGSYHIFTAEGLVWVEAQADGFFAGKTVNLMSDIDMTDVTIANPIKFWNPENRTTFDGQNHTISNLTMSTTSTEKKPFGLFSGTADIMNVKFDNANISGYSYVAVVAGNLYGNIENCHVSNSSVKCTYWMAGALSGQYNSGNVTNCSVTNTTVTGPAAVGALVGNINETKGERELDNCTVTDCKVIQEGSFGGDYDKMFGAAVGLINIEKSTVRFSGTVTNTTVKGEASNDDNIIGDFDGSTKVYINGKQPKSESQKALEAAIAAAADGATVTLSEDVVATQTIEINKNITLDLGGNTISAEFAKNYGAVLNNKATLTIVGGTIKNTAENGEATIINEGDLTLSGAEIIGAPIGNTGYPSYALYTNGGKLVVEDNTKITSDRGAIYIYNGADVTINGGEIKVTNAVGSRTLTAHVIYAYGSSSKLTINDGNFTMNIANGGGTSVICPAGATIAVNGGYFYHATTADAQSGVFQNYMGYGAPVDVYGGTYNDKTVEKNLADGYKVVDNGDGTWSVVAE